MHYFPAHLLRPAKLNDVMGPAIVLPEPGHEDGFLVTGGEQPYVCFIEGRYIGDGFLQEKAGRWSGLAIEGVSFEVEPNSAFKPAMIDQPLGALIRTGTELVVFVGATDSHGFKEATRVTLFAGLSNTSTDTEVAFRKWRAVVSDGPSRLTVFTYEATKIANT